MTDKTIDFNGVRYIREDCVEDMQVKNLFEGIGEDIQHGMILKWMEVEAEYKERKTLSKSAGSVSRSARRFTGSTPPPRRSAITQAIEQNGGCLLLALSFVSALANMRTTGKCNNAALTMFQYP